MKKLLLTALLLCVLASTAHAANYWVGSTADRGALVVIDPGGYVFSIDPIDKINTMIWLPVDEIKLLKSDNALYPFLLVNTSQKNNAHAKLLGRK